MNPSNAKKEATRVTLIGMWLDLVLALGKIVGGSMTGSFALITDGIHSLTDAVTDVFVLLVARVAHDGPDENHPYGHGRFETLGTIGMGMVFFTTAGILLFDSYQRLRVSEDLPIPAASGIAIAVISIIAKEWIYQYTMRVARKLNSSLLKANAWHSRSDAISSVGVMIGLIAAQQGYPWMDTVAAMFVALIIAKIGWELCTDALKEMVDTAVPRHRREQIEARIRETEGVLGVTNLRSRMSGGKIILEIRILVNPRISVSEGHQLGENVSKALIGSFSDIGDVFVHIDPETHLESDHVSRRHTELPERSQVIENIKQLWQEFLDEDDIESIDLHYLEHGIEVDLTVKLDEISEQLASQLSQAIRHFDYIASMRVFNKLYEIKLEQQLS